MVTKQSAANNRSSIIRSSRLVVDDEVKPGAVLIKDGRIEDLIFTGEIPVNIPVLDVGNKAVLPGLIDPHVHINEPGRTAWEGFETATRAAISGGLTLLVDMPLNSTPVTTTVKALEAKRKAAETKLYTQVGFWAGIVPGNAAEIEPLIHEGVMGFKAFLTHSGIDDFPNVSEEDLNRVMPILARHSLPLLVHCELSEEGYRFSDPRSYRQYLASRPKEWEDRAIALMIRLCRKHHCRVHIVHLSSAQSIEPIRKAKEEGLPLTVETAQHYLYFTAESIEDGRTEFKCAPPIREKENNEQLWQALKDGIIDFVATDHSPAPPALKQTGGDLSRAWGGIASLQLAFPVLWTAAQKRGIGISEVAKWMSRNPARLIGMENKKGRLAKGYDADLAIIDLEGSFTVNEALIRHRHPLTPYLHEVLDGVVEQGYLGGQTAFDIRDKNSPVKMGRLI